MPKHIYHEIFFGFNPEFWESAQYDFKIEPTYIEWSSTRDEGKNHIRPQLQDKIKITLPDKVTEDQQRIHFSNEGADENILFCHAFEPPYKLEEIRKRLRGSQSDPNVFGSKLVILGGGKTIYFIHPSDFDRMRGDDVELKTRELRYPITSMYWSEEDERLLVHTIADCLRFDCHGHESRE